MPDLAQGEDAEKALNLLLHELRTPLSVAQGYLRLLLEDRLTDDEERKRAMTQSMAALGRISDLCAGAGELANAVPRAETHRYTAAELMTALAAEAQARGLSTTVQDALPAGHVRTLDPARAAAAIAAVLLGALRHDSGQRPEMCAGVDAGDLLVTSGNAAMRARLIASAGRDAFNPWRGGSGLAVALAAKQLRESGARLWTLAGEASAVAIAIPLELQR